LFLPAFFAFTGLPTQIGLLESGTDWLICFGLVGLATAGKFGGAFLAAKVSGLNTRAAAILGVLMNARGLVGLIVLNAGLDAGVLTPTLFTMLVLMAVVTTVLSGPLLRLLHRPEEADADAKILLFRERNLPSAER
jgi:Kef-type K+ transport system membrane component KefB